ncbi:MAG: hypothetical protein MZV63_21830 [Marinilabiliales bacterium]|nr:hypothetical protein [Marinilabiliales bacterium]
MQTHSYRHLRLFPQIISMYGAGEFDNVALTKMLAGKKASVSLGLQEDNADSLRLLHSEGF